MSLPLVCPACRRPLVDTSCSACGRTYPVVDGIPLLVEPGSEVTDLWEEAESGLSRVLRENPELERALFDAPAAELASADAFLRALVLEERGRGDEVDAAFVRLYPPDTLRCMTSQIDTVCERVLEEPGLVVDLASGRGVLLERLQRAVAGTVVATDISPRVLRRARQRGLDAIACDVRRLPFADGSVDVVTTFAGLNNIREPRDLLAELRRAARHLLAIHLVYEPGTANDAALRELGLAELAYRDAFVAALAEAGWEAKTLSSCTTMLRPTPTGVLLEGAVIDALPVEAVEGTWLTVEAR